MGDGLKWYRFSWISWSFLLKINSASSYSVEHYTLLSWCCIPQRITKKSSEPIILCLMRSNLIKCTKTKKTTGLSPVHYCPCHYCLWPRRTNGTRAFVPGRIHDCCWLSKSTHSPDSISTRYSDSQVFACIARGHQVPCQHLLHAPKMTRRHSMNEYNTRYTLINCVSRAENTITKNVCA